MKLKGVLLSGKVLISYYSRHEGGLALMLTVRMLLNTSMIQWSMLLE